MNRRTLRSMVAAAALMPLLLVINTTQAAILDLPTAAPGQPVGAAVGWTSSAVDLVIGLQIPQGNVIGSPGSLFQYGPPPGFTQIDSRTTAIVVGGATVGTFYDYVFEFRADPVGAPSNVQLALGSRVVLLPSVGGSQNTFEINNIVRRNNTDFTTAQATWARVADADLRLYNASRTQVKFLQGARTFDPNTFMLQSDVNVSEGNPQSGLFYVLSDADDYAVKANAISVYQAGEEGQPLTEVFMSGFAFTAETVVAPVPVPAALPLLLSGMGLLGVANRRRRRARR